MKDTKRNRLSPTSADQNQKAHRRPYEPPRIKWSFTEAQILEVLGPAQGYTGAIPGMGGTL